MAIAGYLTEDQTAEKTRKKIRTLRLWRQLRQGPPWTKLGRTVLYPEDGIVRYLKSQEQQPVRS